MAMAELEGGTLITSWNFSGQRMAAGYVDGGIAVWSRGFGDGSSALSRDFKWQAHGGPLVKLAWGPAEYGDIIASCCTDGAVFVWEEVKENGELKWRLCARLAENPNSYALDLQFGNCLNGLKLITACADGHCRIYETSETIELQSWQLQAVFPNVMDVTEKIGKCSCPGASICWKPPTGSVQQPMFALGYCTESMTFSAAKIWEYTEVHRRWYPVAELPNNKDSNSLGVSSISWAPNLGRSHELIAVASGNTVSIWQLDFSGQKGTSVRRIAELEHGGEVWQAEWDMSGMTLATSCSDGIVRLWQADIDGLWRHKASLEASS